MNEIPGLYYKPDILDYGLAADVLEYLDSEPAKWVPVANTHTSRLVQQYGWNYEYGRRGVVSEAAPIPPALYPLLDILRETCNDLGLPGEFNQSIVNNYYPGQGISPHIDHPSFGPVIGCFTLCGSCGVIFEKNWEAKTLRVEPLSLYIMSGDARNYWTHSMPAVKTEVIDGSRKRRSRRVSVTFRNY